MTQRPIDDLAQTILDCTIPYRKGAEVTEKDVGGVHVIEVNGYPETPSHGKLVDVHFLSIGFSENIAGLTKEDFLALIEKAEQGENGMSMPLSRLKEGPSYIETGAWLGSQDVALRFIALGNFLDLWDVVTPAALHMEGEMADQFAGRGMVMNAGVKL